MYSPLKISFPLHLPPSSNTRNYKFSTAAFSIARPLAYVSINFSYPSTSSATGIHSCSHCIMEYFVLKIICQRFLVLFLNKVIGKQCDSPCTTFTCCLHNINRCIDCSCKDSLSNTFVLNNPPCPIIRSNATCSFSEGYSFLSSMLQEKYKDVLS